MYAYTLIPLPYMTTNLVCTSIHMLNQLFNLLNKKNFMLMPVLIPLVHFRINWSPFLHEFIWIFNSECWHNGKKEILKRWKSYMLSSYIFFHLLNFMSVRLYLNAKKYTQDILYFCSYYYIPHEEKSTIYRLKLNWNTIQYLLQTSGMIPQHTPVNIANWNCKDIILLVTNL